MLSFSPQLPDFSSGVEAGNCLVFKPPRDHSQPLTVHLGGGGWDRTMPVKQRGGSLRRLERTALSPAQGLAATSWLSDSASSFFGARAESP